MALIKGKQLSNGSILGTKIAPAAITDDKLYIAGQSWNFGAASAFSVPVPSSSAHAATKGYVDGVAQGLDVRASVRLATAAALDNWVANSFDKTLIASAVGVTTIDGVSIALGNRILVKNQAGANAVQNGIYVVTVVGDVSTKTVLTRASDFNTTALASPGSFTFVEEGTANADTGWVLSTNAPITLDATALTFTQFSSAGVVTAGNGLSKNGNNLDVNVSASGGIAITNGELNIKVKNTSVATDGDGLFVGLNGEGSIAIKDSAGLAAPIMRPQAGQAVSSNKSTNNADTGLTLAATPPAGGFVQVLINGVMIELGDGVKNKDGYFSPDNLSPARAHNALASGDKFFWNGASVFTLETTDRVDFVFARI